MGQITPSSEKKSYIPLYSDLGAELNGAIIPKNVGVFHPTKQKGKKGTGWTTNYQGTRQVGGHEVRATKNSFQESYDYDTESVRKLRQMGFSPEQILKYFELKKETHRIQEKPINNPENEAVSIKNEKTLAPKEEIIPASTKETEINTILESKQKREMDLHIKIITGRSKSVIVPKTIGMEAGNANILNKEGSRKNTLTILRPFLKEKNTNTEQLTQPQSQPIHEATAFISPESITPITPTSTNSVESLPKELSPKKIVPINPVSTTEGKEQNGVVLPVSEIKETSLTEEAQTTTEKTTTGDSLSSDTLSEPITTTLQEAIQNPSQEKEKDLPPNEQTHQKPQQNELAQNPTGISQEKERKLKAAQAVGEVLLARGKYLTSSAKWSGPKASDVRVVSHDNTLDTALAIKQRESWEDSPKIQGIRPFLNDLTSLNEEALFTKYVPLYINPNNPSSLASVSGFSAHEIIHGSETVYGLPHDTRLEISGLLKYLGTIDEITDSVQTVKKYGAGKLYSYQDYLTFNPKLATQITIHEYYEEVRKRIAEADKIENN